MWMYLIMQVFLTWDLTYQVGDQGMGQGWGKAYPSKAPG